MRNALGLCICLALLATAGTAAQKEAEGTPPGEQLVGTWSGTWDSAGNTAKGTWAARVKASGEEMAAGTWTVTKK